MNKLRERGFSAVEGAVIILLVVAVATAGWFVASRMQKDDEKSLNTAQQTSDTTKAPAINETEDLDTASSALDYTDLDTTSDTNDLDTQTNAF